MTLMLTSPIASGEARACILVLCGECRHPKEFELAGEGKVLPETGVQAVLESLGWFKGETGWLCSRHAPTVTAGKDDEIGKVRRLPWFGDGTRTGRTQSKVPNLANGPKSLSHLDPYSNE